ncbi:MAG: hypothetical protein AVDCRST_MAG96-2823 [uncultured Segetibacter sp.]|uniref:Uncharacterized protein n=1 Tax=uncultured Segetibacter sp. TaxID=481133 RepID=A0A6J4TBC1_9BACT|nr:MAG: hypothetical protein AVDCRST_MAG96-2823 [uncultured Segetibacter sp.]
MQGFEVRFKNLFKSLFVCSPQRCSYLVMHHVFLKIMSVLSPYLFLYA